MADAERPAQQIRLLTGSSMDAASRRACIEHLDPDVPATTTVLAVSLTRSPDAWLRQFRETADALPNRIGLVVSGDPSRSASAVSGSSEWQLPPTESVSATTVDDPGDLTELGIKITNFVEQWADRREPDDDQRLLFCFDSLTVLLQYVELERAFRFLHVLVGRLRRQGVQAHFHLDQSTQDDQAVATLVSLFDEVEGDVELRRPSAREP